MSEKGWDQRLDFPHPLVLYQLELVDPNWLRAEMPIYST